MPYIKDEDRKKLIDTLLIGSSAQNEGELNYMISRLCFGYLSNKGLKYANCNTIIGALECAKIEFYRKIISDYEDIKEQQNGTVWR